MEQLVVSRTQFINHKVYFQKKIWNKNKKGEIVPKNFDFFYSAVNARLKRRKNKHLFDLILNSLRIELSHSDNIILDN